MKKKLSYRDKLLELAYIYNVKEIQDYTKRRMNLTTGQIELILKKNKIIIPKEFKTSFFKENFTKHNSNKGAKSTKGFKWELVYKKIFKNKSEALSYEYKLKKDKKKRFKLINEYNKKKS